jgi:hypothetical protein
LNFIYLDPSDPGILETLLELIHFLKQVAAVLHNLNKLRESHDSYVATGGDKKIIR